MKVFLSCVAQDEAWAATLRSRLEAEGLEVWNPRQSILPGDNFAAMHGDALAKADAMVVLLSPDSVHSEWIRSEIQYALGTPRFKGRLIPVLVRPTSGIPWILQTLQMVEAGNPAEAADRVVQALSAVAAPRSRSREAR
jgi:TIR domain-containing protein